MDRIHEWQEQLAGRISQREHGLRIAGTVYTFTAMLSLAAAATVSDIVLFLTLAFWLFIAMPLATPVLKQAHRQRRQQDEA